MSNRRLPPLRSLEAFMFTVRLGSARAAADELGLSPSALSRRIGNLETFVGKKLFTRARQSMQLTDDGHAFFEAVNPQLEALARATGPLVHALRERAEVTTRRLNGIEGISCVPPRAAFYAMPKVALPPGRTDEDYVVGLLRATGLLCVYGSGFGTAPGDGFLRIVFLAAPPELEAIYDTIAAFTERFRARG